MKQHIVLHSTVGMSNDDWLAYRFRGLGASETGVVLGLSRYKSAIELFYEKIGETHGYNVENMAMFLGKESEPFLALMWEFWDPAEPTNERMIANYRAGVKVRRCKRVNAYATNPKYPWLFVSLDREMNKHGAKDNGSLELKTIGGYEADKWQNGLPPAHIIQVQTQMGVCEYEHGEIAIMQDNRDFMVWPFEYSKNIFDEILEKTKIFWDKVEAARVVVTKKFEAKRNFSHHLLEDLEAELQQLQPEPDGSEAYSEFLNKKYQIARPGEQAGTLEQLAVARAHSVAKEKVKEWEEAARTEEQALKLVFRDGADRLDFKGNGYVSWKANAKGSRVFLNKTKD